MKTNSDYITERFYRGDTVQYDGIQKFIGNRRYISRRNFMTVHKTKNVVRCRMVLTEVERPKWIEERLRDEKARVANKIFRDRLKGFLQEINGREDLIEFTNALNRIANIQNER